jgi:hypothetical protein
MTRMLSFTFSRIELLIAVAILVAIPASGQEFTFHALHDFVGSDGAFPFGNLISDSAGNVYGVAGAGGIQNSAGWVKLRRHCNLKQAARRIPEVQPELALWPQN